MRNLARDPRATVLVDAYDEDWSTVWWVRLRGRGVTDARSGPMPGSRCGTSTRSSGTPRRPRPPVPPMMAVDIEQWAGWAYSD
jgi:hypothetical protein